MINIASARTQSAEDNAVTSALGVPRLSVVIDRFLLHRAARRTPWTAERYRGASAGSAAATRASSAAANHWRVRLQKEQTDSITGTSTSRPTTVASVAPDVTPKSEMAVATA